MTNRPLAIASLLMIAAAVSAGPALASDPQTLGFTGPPPEAVEPSAGIIVLHSPRGVGHSEDLTLPPPEESDRPNIDQLIRDYSTVTISPGGGTTVSAPSAALRAVIEDEYAAGRL